MGWVHIVEFYDEGVKVAVEKNDNNLIKITRFPNPNTVQEIYLTPKGLSTIIGALDDQVLSSDKPYI